MHLDSCTCSSKRNQTFHYLVWNPIKVHSYFRLWYIHIYIYSWVARKFTGPRPKKLDLCAARKSRISTLPDYRSNIVYPFTVVLITSTYILTTMQMNGHKLCCWCVLYLYIYIYIYIQHLYDTSLWHRGPYWALSNSEVAYSVGS